MSMDFKKNVGTTDKIIRTMIAIGLGIGGFFLKGWMRIVSFVLSALLFISSIFSYCSMYDLFGCSTKE